MIEVVCQYEGFSDEDLSGSLSGLLDLVLADNKRSGFTVNLVFCGDDLIAEYNKEYRGKDGPTDVLSFSQEEGEEMEGFEEEAPVLGDILISIDRARVQAHEYGVSFREEMARLAIHGILHLLGYDHEKSSEAEKVMLDIQDRILSDYLAGSNKEAK